MKSGKKMADGINTSGSVPAKPAPKRKRQKINLTLSDKAREAGRIISEHRGIKFSQLVEMLLREELRKDGKLPPK